MTTPTHSMQDLAQTYLYCFMSEYNRIAQVDSQSLDLVFKGFQHLASRVPYFMFGPQQLIEMSAILFGDTAMSSPKLTEFVLSLTTSLQACLIRDGQDIVQLCRDLANALTIREDDAPPTYDSTATVFAERFVPMSTILATLKTNRWLLTVLLGVWFMPNIVMALEEEVKNRSGKKSKNVALLSK